jgi:hypothetical protein
LASMHDRPDPNPTVARSEPAAEAETSEKRLRFVRRRVARDDLEAAE